MSGTWVSERLTEPPEGFMHVDPVLARDTDSSLWVAYAEVTETGSRGVFVLTTRAGGWSEATLIADCNCSSPSLAIAQGVAHLALKESAPFEQSGIARTMHATNARGGWSVTEVAAGTAPMLALAPDGRPFILFSDNGNLLFAEWQGEAGGFAVSAGPGTSSAARYRPSLAFRPDGTLDAIWADGNTLWWAQGQSSQWSTPETLLTDLTDADPQGIAIGADGIMHGVAVGWQAGVWHVSGRAGTFDARQLAEGMPAGAALAVDQQGRAHIAYVIGRGYEPGHGVTAPELWYGVWPEAGIAD